MKIIKKIFGWIRPTRIRIGENIVFSCESHGSVGITSAIKYDDIFFDCEIKKNVPQNCPPGGDYGEKFYILKAKKKGNTLVEITEYFRGDITNHKCFRYKII